MNNHFTIGQRVIVKATMEFHTGQLFEEYPDDDSKYPFGAYSYPRVSPNEDDRYLLVRSAWRTLLEKPQEMVVIGKTRRFTGRYYKPHVYSTMDGDEYDKGAFFKEKGFNVWVCTRSLWFSKPILVLPEDVETVEVKS